MKYHIFSNNIFQKTCFLAVLLLIYAPFDSARAQSGTGTDVRTNKPAPKKPAPKKPVAKKTAPKKPAAKSTPTAAKKPVAPPASGSTANNSAGNQPVVVEAEKISSSGVQPSSPTPPLPPQRPRDEETEPLFGIEKTLLEGIWDEGFRRKGDFFKTSLDDDQLTSTDVAVTQGKQYVMLAVCDGSCPKLSLEVRDGSNALVGENKRNLQSANLRVSPAQTGTYRVKIRAVACRKEPCQVALAVYEK